MKPQQEREQQLKDRRLWLHRWLVCVSLVGSLAASILAVILTQHPLFASIPATILLAMRPTIRWLYKENEMGGGQDVDDREG
jgi:hypothetical protein